MHTSSYHLLEIDGLDVEYVSRKGRVRAVRDVTFALDSGNTLGIVGESGCGKSTLAFSIIRCIFYPGKISRGSILFNGLDLLRIPEDKMRFIRGREISMIPQDPMTSLNPVMKIGDHFIEMIRNHEPQLTKIESKKKALDILEKLGIPAERFGDYPHQFSGGMRQRAMIGLALVMNPKLVIADEPTTSLDALVEAQILELLKKLQKELNLSLILITHNIGVVAEICQRVIVMYAGQIVEEASTLQLFDKPLHPYTQALLASVPNPTKDTEKLNWIPGSPPSLQDVPIACSYSPRCPYAFERCKRMEPSLINLEGRRVRCFLYG